MYICYFIWVEVIIYESDLILTCFPAEEDSITNKDATDEHGLTYSKWVGLFLQHTILASKAKSAEANQSRKLARESIAKVIKQENSIHEMTGEQVRKAFNNKKSRLSAKNDIKRTGNVAISLNEDEKTFLSSLEDPCYNINAKSGVNTANASW